MQLLIQLSDGTTLYLTRVDCWVFSCPLRILGSIITLNLIKNSLVSVWEGVVVSEGVAAVLVCCVHRFFFVHLRCCTRSHIEAVLKQTAFFIRRRLLASALFKNWRLSGPPS
jgi:hypothetical protein